MHIYRPSGRYQKVNPMNEKQLAAAQTRERLIEAALVVLREQGMQHLTLDTVAKQAGVSKGGLLHHFPSKDALIQALALYLYDSFEACVQRHYDAHAIVPGRWLRAYIRATFEPFDVPFEALFGLFVYGRDSIDLQSVMHADHARWQARLLDDGVTPVTATVIRMVCDSYWSERVTNLPQNVPAETLQAYLLSLLD